MNPRMTRADRPARGGWLRMATFFLAAFLWSQLAPPAGAARGSLPGDRVQVMPIFVVPKGYRMANVVKLPPMDLDFDKPNGPGQRPFAPED